MSQDNSIPAIILNAYGQYIRDIMESDLSKEMKSAKVDAIARYIEILNESLKPQLEQMAADKKLLAAVATRLTRIVG